MSLIIYLLVVHAERNKHFKLFYLVVLSFHFGILRIICKKFNMRETTAIHKYGLHSFLSS